MKTYITLISIFISVIGINAQNINQLMNDFTNKFALEHMELYTKDASTKFGEDFLSPLPPMNQSIRLTGINTVRLNNIKNLVIQNPSILFPFLDTQTHNLSAYLLFSHIFEIDIPSEANELVFLNLILKNQVLDPSEVASFISNNPIPAGVTVTDRASYVLNKVWNEEVAPEATPRIRQAVLNL